MIEIDSFKAVLHHLTNLSRFDNEGDAIAAHGFIDAQFPDSTPAADTTAAPVTPAADTTAAPTA